MQSFIELHRSSDITLLHVQGSSDVQMMQLKQHANGAACGVAVEPLSNLSLAQLDKNIWNEGLKYRFSSG